jgi:glycine cleavage system transcriptional repressor
VTDIAVTIVGPDRPGIVAEVSAALAGLRLNLTDSTMTLLRGHFAMMLVCTPDPDAGDVNADQVNAALEPLAVPGHLIATARTLEDDESAGVPGAPYTLVVHGADRLGIVAAMTAVVARHGGNITDLTTRLAGTLYSLTAEIDVPDGADIPTLNADLAAQAERLGVTANLIIVEADML